MHTTAEWGALGALGLMMGVVFATTLILLLPTILYLATLARALGKCGPRNRTMPGGLVWLNLIPFFNRIWHFFIVVQVAQSLENEFRERGVQTEAMPGQALGLAMCILRVCNFVPGAFVFTWLPGLVCWIAYWIRVAGYSAQLDRTSKPEEAVAEPPAANACNGI